MMYETFIGLRYTLSRRGMRHKGNGFISFISLASMLGVALGVMALIVVLSVMNGFQEELRSRILGVAAHVQIIGHDGHLSNWQQVAQEAQQHPSVQASAPYVEQQALVTLNQHTQGVIVRGILPTQEEQVAKFKQYMQDGLLESLQAGKFHVVLGRDLASTLGVEVGDKLTLVTPQGLVTPAALLPRIKQFVVSGIFNSGMSEYDSGLVLINMQDAQVLYRMGDDVSGVRLKLDDIFNAPNVSLDLANMIKAPAYITDWTRNHGNFFHAVALEKTMMTLILFLIVAVAAFNIVSTLVMTVQDKQSDIAILRTLGASPRSIMAIFMLQGAVIGVLGLVFGVIAGLLIAHNLDVVIPFLETVSGSQLWNKQIYFVSQMPSKVVWSDVVSIIIVSFLLSLAATLYPSWKASRINPAEALSYE